MGAARELMGKGSFGQVFTRLCRARRGVGLLLSPRAPRFPANLPDWTAL